MSNTLKKDKNAHKGKKTIRREAKGRAVSKIKDDNVCVIEETLLPARMYFYEEECCCIL